jgi:ABC-type branched-subunit amino acid transport system substrate-binding protein
MLKTFLMIAFSVSLHAGEIHLGLLGNMPDPKPVELLAAKIAVDAANANPARTTDPLRLIPAHDKGTLEGALEGAHKLADDPEMVGVVIHGEEGVAPEVLKIFSDAGIAVVAASSWATARPLSSTVTWLSPSQDELASIGAQYVKKARQVRQVAVIDNGAPTAAAAATAFAEKFTGMGGKVNYAGQWQGTDWGLTRTVKALAANWPQVVFFAGDGRDAGVLVKAIQKEKSLKNSVLLGLPTLFDPEFINIARTDTKHTTVVFPCPDFTSSVKIAKYLGVSFERKTSNYQSYVHFAYKKPGRWTSMVFDATQLLVSATDQASAAGTALSPTAGAAPALSPAASASGPSRQGVLEALRAIGSYKGIRGKVKFGPTRQPLDPKAMIFNAQPKVNTREMRWYDYNYGPPF